MVSPLNLPGLGGPFGHEAKRVFARRLRREGFEPYHGSIADVRERVYAAHTGPQHVAGLRRVLLAVHRRLDLAAEKEIALLEGMVVKSDADAGLVLDEQ